MTWGTLPLFGVGGPESECDPGKAGRGVKSQVIREG